MRWFRGDRAAAFRLPKDPVMARAGRRLGYLSAAPRVSTKQIAEAGGPRAHVRGVILAFEKLGWTVHSYIVGNQVPAAWIVRSEETLERHVLFRLAADLARLAMGIWHSVRAYKELIGRVDWLYERFAVLQSLGWIFQHHQLPWILETSGLIYYEAHSERRSVFLSAIARKLELWAYRRCDVLICVSESLKNLVVREANISPQKVLVVPNGVDVERFDPERYTPKRFFEGPTLGFAGNLYQWHRLDILLRVLAQLRGEGLDLNFVVLGDGPMRKTWEAQADELGILEGVRFLGRVGWEEVPDHIAGFDLGYAGNGPLSIGVMYHSPLKLYEYMAMARPVVASAYADARELISTGENGYLFQPGSAVELEQVLRMAYQEKDRWHAMGMAARRRVTETASWQTRIQSAISGIERILETGIANSAARN